MSDKTPTNTEQLAGKTLGRYEIKRILGRGGMAVVYEAYDTRERRSVALKIPTPEVAAEPGALNRFEQEGRITARVRSPNIVNVHAIGTIHDVTYIAMELVNGHPLSRVIQRVRQMDPAQAMVIARQIASALIEVHKLKIYHRDIKPKNLILSDEGIVKLMDFGVAEQHQELEDEGEKWVGTPAYLAPEQILHHPSDHRTDIYALGIVLFEMLAGRPPFETRPGSPLYQQITADALPPLRRFNPAVSLELERIVERAAAKRPEMRYPTAEEMYVDLAREISSIETRTGSRITLDPLLKKMGDVREDSGEEPGPGGTQPWRDTGHRSRRRGLSIPWKGIGMALALLAAAGLAGLGARRIIPKLKSTSTRVLAVTRACKGDVHTAAVSTETMSLLAGGEDGPIQRFDLSGVGANPLRLLFGAPSLSALEGGPLKGHASDVLWIASANERAYSSGTDMTLRAWDLKSGKGDWVMKLGGHTIQQFALLPGGNRALAACSDYKLRMINLNDHSVGGTYAGHSSVVYAVAVSQGGSRAVSGDAKGRVILWNLETGAAAARAETGGAIVSGADYSPRGDRAATVGWDGHLRIWNAADGGMVSSVQAGTAALRCVLYTPGGGHILTGGEDGVIRLFEAGEGREIRILEGHAGPVLCLAPGPASNRFVSSGADGTVRLWQLSSEDGG